MGKDQIETMHGTRNITLSVRVLICAISSAAVMLFLLSCGGGGSGESSIPKPNTEWAVTFTHRGALLPEEAINFICDTVKPEIIAWIKREADKYNQPYPFETIKCYREQILLTGNLLTPDMPGFTGLNEPAVANLINDTFWEKKFVTVVHYLGVYDEPFNQNMYDSKYDFYYFKWADFSPPLYPLYPALSVNSQGETLIHELMHKLGATDKYNNSWEHACQIDPATGQEYSGYDIMCHRIPDPDCIYPNDPSYRCGYIFPKLSELIISEPTAKELGWVSK